MCIIVDLNTLPEVFNKQCHRHTEFRPVLEWIVNDKGKLVYGGSKYKRELSRLKKYLHILTILDKQKKIVKVSDRQIDHEQEIIDRSFRHRSFNDSHIVAIVIVSGCKLICSADTTSLPFLKRTAFYSGRVKKPKIYSGRKNKNLLTDHNIAEICKPCRIIGKSIIDQIQSELQSLRYSKKSKR